MPGTNSNPPQGQLSSVLAHNKVKCTARNCCQLSQQPSAISHDNHILRYYYCRGPPSPTKLESKSQPTFSRGNCLPLPMQSSASGASEVTGNFHVSWPAGGSGAGWLDGWMAWSSGVCQRPPHQPKPSKGRQLSVGWRPKRISRLATRRILAGGVKEPKETFLANAFIALSRLNVSPLRNGSLLAWGGWHVSTGPLPAEELY